MDSGRGKMRLKVEGDRLSSLPDDLIHKILSFRPIKDAIGTSVLSSRWRFIWTTMPYLNFSSKDFPTLPDFSKFVTHVLSGRDNRTDVYSVKLCFRGKVSQVFVKRILNYAFSHNIQQLNVIYLHENDIDFPISLCSSKSLKHLSLTMPFGRYNRNRGTNCSFTPTSTWNWNPPTLTTLDLHNVTLCDDKAEKCIRVFSKCPNLKNLTLKGFDTRGSDGFSIFHPRLSNLTLESSSRNVKVINVAAPQLENLTIRFCHAEHVVSAPDLASFLYKGLDLLHLSTDGFHSLKKANISISDAKDEDGHQIVCLLQQLHNVHFLTLNLEIVEILSSSMDLILHQPSPFVNLKSLNIYPERTNYWWMRPHKKVTMSTKLKSYLLDSSPGSSFTMVLREEIQAQNIMAELRVLLEKEEDNSKANKDHLEQGKTPVASHKPKKVKIGGNIAHIKSCWENVGAQITKSCLIISKLQETEELLRKLPASNRAKIQQYFSSLCIEADIAISKITDCVKIQCDKNQRRSRVCFHELATKMEPSS